MEITPTIMTAVSKPSLLSPIRSVCPIRPEASGEFSP